MPAIQRRFPQWEIVRYLDAKVPWPYPADGAARYVANCLGSMARGDRSHWAIIPRRGSQEAIGLIGLKPDDEICFSQCGYWIDPEFQGRGLMMEALDSVTATPSTTSSGRICGRPMPRTIIPRAVTRNARARAWSIS